MLRFALTGKELSELYMLSAMGVPSSEETIGDIDRQHANFLLDTIEGRQLLLDYADDLYEHISNANYLRINEYRQDYINEYQPTEEELMPSDEELSEYAFEYLDDILRKSGDQMSSIIDKNNQSNWWALQNQGQSILPGLYASAIQSMHRSSQAGNTYDELDDAIYNMLGKISNDVGSGWDEIIWDAWEIIKWRNAEGSPEDTVRDFYGFIRNLANDDSFKEALWPKILNDNRGRFEKDFKRYLEGDEDQFLEDVYDPSDAHFAIDDETRELVELISSAQNSGDRSDYAAVLMQVDKLSSMSHHGGPAFEYADSTYFLDDLNLIEAMHRKYGDRFIPWLMASGNFPEDWESEFQEWYADAVNRESYDAYINDTAGASSDDYYKHPYYSQRKRWIAEHSPTYRGWTPFSEEMENAANLRSIEQAILSKDVDVDRKENIRNFLGNKTTFVPPDIPQLDPYGIRQPWGNLQSEAQIRAGMSRLASSLDEIGQADLADRVGKWIFQI